MSSPAGFGMSPDKLRIVAVPDAFPEKWDLADPVPEGETVETLRALIRDAEPWSPIPKAQVKAEALDAAGTGQRGFLVLREWIRDGAGNSHAPGVYKQVEKEDKETGLKVKSWSWFCSLLGDRGRDPRRVRPAMGPAAARHRPRRHGARVGHADGHAGRRRYRLPRAPALARPGAGTGQVRPRLPARVHHPVAARGEGPLRRPDRLARPRLRPARCHLSATPGGESVILQTAGTAPAYDMAGTLDGWRDDVARYAVGNSRLGRGALRPLRGAAALPPERGERRLPLHRRLLDRQDDGPLLRCFGLGCRGALLARDRQRRRGAWPAVPATPSLRWTR